MQTLDFESDQFLTLLTDALRAGPGSPQWHQAVVRLRESAPGADDELRLLLEAREHLESGKAYRAIRAGAGFTRKVMEGIDREAKSKPPRVQPTTVIASVSVAVAAIILTLLAYVLMTAKGPPSPVDELVGRYFGTPLAEATFTGDLPDGWREIGALPLSFKKLLSLDGKGDDAAGGGGIVTLSPVSADQTVAFEVAIRPGKGGGKGGDAVIPQVFVTDDPDFSSDKATSPHELAWFIENHKTQVALPDQTLAGLQDALNDQPILVRFVVGPDLAAVQTDGKVIWSGPPGLSASEPRYFGVRFLRRRADHRTDRPAVTSMKLLTDSQK
jgi:hypothetical protein